MKTMYKLLILGFALNVSSVFAYNDRNASGIDQGSNGQKGSGTEQEKGAGCSPANTRLTMDFNAVSCQLETGGLLFLDRANQLATYRVPKTGQASAIFAGSLWMGGKDVNGQLKLAAVRYRDTGNDFWPGPLTVTHGSGNYDPHVVQGDDAVRDYGDANVTPEVCLAYDKIYTIRKAEVIQFITWWQCSPNNPTPPTDGCTTPVDQPDADIMIRIENWPGNMPDGDYDQFLAPFYDNPNAAAGANGEYNALEDGDYPFYDDILGHDFVTCGVDRRITLFGDETHWWVFNDKGNIHTETGGDPIGMEIRAQAFAFATDDEVNNMTFYNYELINRGTQTLDSTFFAQYVDADLGGYSDDYVGCDVSRGLGYTYNGDNFDQTVTGKPGYGANPPAIGVDFFEGPYQNSDGIANPLIPEGTPNATLAAIAAGGIVYGGIGTGYNDTIPDNERFGMRRFTYYTSTAQGSQSDPSAAVQYYNYMKGKWRFGDAMVYGGTGFPGSAGSTSIHSDYMFPNDSDPLNWATEGAAVPYSVWSEFEPAGPGSTQNASGDRRFVQAAGPFTLKPGAVNNITVGIVYGRGSGGELFSSVEAMERADTKAQALFDNCFKILEPPVAPALDITELSNELIMVLTNPPGSNNHDENYAEKDLNIVPSIDSAGVQVPVDQYYHFEGYQIFQMVTAETSAADLDDPTKARLVAQCDIKNGVGKLINFEFDEALGFSIPVEKVDGENKGIRHSFRILNDAFASGDAGLVNYKTYYYMAVAYGYNNFKTYNPDDPTGLDGQKKPYLRSRIGTTGEALVPIAAVPHRVEEQSGGTIVNAVYGETPRITRRDGKGNGDNALKLTSESENTIVQTGFMATPEYDYGGAPITVKVIDPLNVAPGYYVCKFRDYTTAGSEPNGIDTASWTIYRYVGGTLVDQVNSDETIIRENEQVINSDVQKWGISVEIHQEQYKKIGTALAQDEYTETISSSIEYKDSTKLWVRFIEDDDLFYPTNWILDGTYSPTAASDCAPLDPAPHNYLNPCCYADIQGLAPEGMFSSLLGGGIAPQKLVASYCDYSPLAYPYTSYPSARAKARISYAPSIDIVITSDKSKWTRCPVIELGGDPALNVGGQTRGKLRKSPSVDKNGNPDGSGTYGLGWFPGYAIDLESGARLHMAFGENSFLGGENGSNMKWDPTDTYIDANGVPAFGGQHVIYVYGYQTGTTGIPAYDGINNWVYDRYMDGSSAELAKAVSSLMWVCNIMTQNGHTANETDVRLSVRVNKEYEDFTATGENGGKPMYTWSMDDIQTVKGNTERMASVLDLINVVPNPYYAYSEYEKTRLDNVVKITNLPDKCTISIYTVAGKLVRSFKKDSSVPYQDWDLKNTKGIPIASGVYIIHVEVPDAGEKIVKFFGGVRQVDLENI